MQPWAEVSTCACIAAALQRHLLRIPGGEGPQQGQLLAFKVGEERTGKLVPSSNKNISVVWDFSSLARLVAVTLLVCRLLLAQLWVVGNEEKPAAVPGTGRGDTGVWLAQSIFGRGRMQISTSHSLGSVLGAALWRGCGDRPVLGSTKNFLRVGEMSCLARFLCC